MVETALVIAGAKCIGETGVTHKKYGHERKWSCHYCSCVFIGYNHVPKNRSKRGGLAHCGCQTKSRMSLPKKGSVPPNKLDDLSASAHKVYASSTKVGRTITQGDVKSLISSDCHYCGASPSLHRELGSKGFIRKSEVPTNGIDRMYSDKGYHLDNCVPCCSRCNYLKRGMPYDEFLDVCSTISLRFPH